MLCDSEHSFKRRLKTFLFNCFTKPSDGYLTSASAAFCRHTWCFIYLLIIIIIKVSQKLVLMTCYTLCSCWIIIIIIIHLQLSESKQHVFDTFFYYFSSIYSCFLLFSLEFQNHCSCSDYLYPTSPFCSFSNNSSFHKTVVTHVY